MRSVRSAILALGFVGALVPAALASLAGGALPDRWQSGLGRDHPLAGAVWEVASGRSLDVAGLAARLVRTRFVLVGERHDNADHHLLQAWVVRMLVAAGRRPAVVLEMLDADDQPAVERYLAMRPPDGAGLGDAVEWSRSGWPAFAMYRPIVDAAVTARLPLRAGNLSREELRSVRRAGLGGLEATRRARLGLDEALAPRVATALASAIDAAHCGHVPAGRLTRMVEVQRARDAQMADALVVGADPDGAVLIAGAGHVRRDRGVPYALRARVPGASLVTVALVEVREGATAPSAYVERDADGGAAFDYLWFTARVDDVDPCEKFAGSLEQLRPR